MAKTDNNDENLGRSPQDRNRQDDSTTKNKATHGNDRASEGDQEMDMNMSSSDIDDIAER